MTGPISNYVVVVPHSHWDREWYLPFEAFRMRLVKLMDSLCEMLEDDPEEFFHMDGQTVVLEDYEAIRGRSERLRALVKNGRIAIGPWYAQPDEFLPSGEAIIRNLQMGIKISKEWGKPELVGYLPDMFGHMGQMPQIFKGFGINRAVVFRGTPKEVTKCGFIWRARDGSEVFTAFLPMGYMNGFALPRDPAKLRGRLMIGRALIDKFIEGPAWLLMAGTDHQQPQRGQSVALKNTFGNTPGWEIKIGSLSDYFQRLEAESKARPVVTGELRSVHYAPILPATGSTRVYLKKHDFVISSILERYAEPIASWVWALGGTDRRDFIEHAWKLLLKNHAHDSICGTSTDEVHREMETRFNRAETVARRTLNEASIELGSMIKLPAGKKWFGVWGACGGVGPVPIIAEIDGKPAKSAAFENPDGRQIPLQMLDVLEQAEIVGQATMPVFAADLVLAFLFQEEEMLSGWIVSAETKKEKDTLKLIIGIGRSPVGFDLEAAKAKFEKDIASSGATILKVLIEKLPRVRVAAVAEQLPPFSVAAFHIARSKQRTETRFHSNHAGGVIESSLWRVVAGSDGALTIHDRHNDLTFKNALKYVDQGDRGDEYNFEPVPGETPIGEPVSTRARKLYEGTVAAGMRVESSYKIPAGLDKSGKLRSKSMVPIKIITDVIVYKDVNWIDFRVNFDNNARDHRLRVLFEAPFITDELICETAFEVARRAACVTPAPRTPNPSDPLSLLIGPEAGVGFGPHRGFAALENNGIGMALFNRALLEIEAVKGDEGVALALTLLRGVGALSRDDLTFRFGHAGPPIPTPDAQCLGPQTCEFAFTSYKGSWSDINLPALAQSWRHPAFLFRIPKEGYRKKPTAYSLQPTAFLIQGDNPAIQIRALQPAPTTSTNNGSKALCARIYNTTDKTQKAKLNFNEIFKSVSEADFMGVTIEDKHLKRESHSTILELPGAKIITLRLEF